MKRYALSLALTLGVLEFSTRASAQTDSSRYDIGYLTLNKDFTQHISIRGEDLEKMPFTNLSDAIRAWLFGAYTGQSFLAYVVDGNPVTDVNLYPIYDIEEVTYISNAVATAAYGGGQKGLVLITTKRGKRPAGMRVTAQTGLVKGNSGLDDTHTNIYHQYYLGAYKNMDKVSFGVSEDWQRDVLPMEKWPTLTVNTPNNLRRWRTNGWLDWRPDQRNTIGIRLGYMDQEFAEGWTTGDNNNTSRETNNQHTQVVIPELSWEGRWLRGLRNRFNAEYVHYSSDEQENGYYLDNLSTPPSSGSSGQSVSDGFNELLLRDRLSYETTAGGWHIVPMIDLSYQHIAERYGYSIFQQSNTTTQGMLKEEDKGSLFYITPAVDLTLARALDIEAGVLANASSRVDTGNRRFFPFLTAAVDLLHLNAADAGRNSWKLFGSYARRPMLYIDGYSSPDLTSAGADQSLFAVLHGREQVNYFGTGGAPVEFGSVEPGYWTWQAGTAFRTGDGRVTLQYSFERRNYSFVMVRISDGKEGYEPWTASFHHVDLRFKLLDSKAASWLTGLALSLVKSKGDKNGFYQNIGLNDTPIGDVYPNGYSWMGGWVNRLQFGRFSAGLDVLYHLGAVAHPGMSKNTAVAPNIYAGYRFGLPHERGLELFVESRELVMNRPTDLADGRRYYTLGASLAL